MRRDVWPTLPVIALLCCGVFLAACTGASATPTSPPRPTFPPTPTIEITPVPLLLTPITSPEPLPGLPPLLPGQSSKSLALHGDRLVTANSDSGSVTLVDVAAGAVLAEIAVGNDPRTVAITPDGTIALVALRGDHSLAVVDLEGMALAATIPVGHMPYGVVTDGRRAYVSCFGEDRVAVVDLAAGEVFARLDVPDSPSGLALDETGEWLLVTHFYSGLVTLANVIRTPFVVGSVNAEPDGNLARTILLAPDGGRAYIPQMRTGLALVSLQYMQDWFPVVSVLDVSTMRGDRAARLTLTMIDAASNLPFDAAFTADGSALWVVLAGSDEVLVVDAGSSEALGRIAVGANPRGIVLTEDRAYVLNALVGTVSVIATDDLRMVDTITVTDIPLDPDVLRGKVLFNQASAPVMSDGAVSCATCHFDGGMDRRTWINFRSGPRNTLALGGAADLPPYNWAGDMAELQDTLEDHVRNVMLGDGLIDGAFDPTTGAVDAGRSADLDALAAYVASFQPWPSPYREPDGALSESARRGMQLFMSGSPDCSCHTPPLYTDLLQHNLAGVAFSMEVFEAFDTPTLRGLWASAPYMHDGVAQTLEEVLTRTDPVHSVAAGLTPQQLADLIAFLRSL